MPITITGGVALSGGVGLGPVGSGGGGGGSSPTNPLGLSGTYSYDSEFGYLVALSDIDVSPASFTLGSSSTNFSQGTTLGRYMADSDFSTVMTNATYITFALYNTSDLASTPTNLSSVDGSVFTKSRLTSDPSVTAFPTSSLGSYPTSFTTGSGASRIMFMHDEDSGNNASGLDYSIFMLRQAGQIKETGWSSTASGFFSAASNGSTLSSQASYPPGERSWDNYNALAIYVTNSSTQPTLT